MSNLEIQVGYSFYKSWNDCGSVTLDTVEVTRPNDYSDCRKAAEELVERVQKEVLPLLEQDNPKGYKYSTFYFEKEKLYPGQGIDAFLAREKKRIAEETRQAIQKEMAVKEYELQELNRRRFKGIDKILS